MGIVTHYYDAPQLKAQCYRDLTTRIETRRKNYVRSHMLDFIQSIGPQWDHEAIDAASRAGEMECPLPLERPATSPYKSS